MERDYSKPVSEEQEAFIDAFDTALVEDWPELTRCRRLLAEFARKVEAHVLEEFDKCVVLFGEIPYMDISPATCCDAKLASTIHHVRTLLLEEKDGHAA